MTARIVVLLVAPAAVAALAADPVYIGARVCGNCHAGPGMGYQFSLWLHSKHSQAWATLAKPESKKIAQISGIREDPQESFTCLGCHSSGAQAEAWQKDDTFRVEDGVQCESCHGPGSEYATEAIMKDRAAAMKAGLQMPTEQTCMTCHIVKGSHVAVLASPQFDVKKGLAAIAHPAPPNPTMESIRRAVADGAGAKEGPKYVGSEACGKCHRGPQNGYQYSVWRMSGHARAWSTLSSEKSREALARRGLTGDPQTQPYCLSCHSPAVAEGAAAVLPSFSPDEGVGCESCHGPGSDYMAEAVMRDPRAARAAGLKTPDEQTCARCHKNVHGAEYELRREKIAHPKRPAPVAREPDYKTPVNLALRPDGKELYVTCSGSDSVAVVDPLTRRKVAEIPVGGQPDDVAFTPDGRRAFVSNMFDDTVSVIDVATRTVTKTLEAGDEPHGVLVDKQGKYCYVLNTGSEDISVFDAASLEWIKNLSASRRPWSLALSPDGSRIVVTHTLPRLGPFRAPPVAETTIIDATRATVEDRPIFPGANLLMGAAWHPSGEYALLTLNRTKTLVPMTRLAQGWTITNGLGILSLDGEVDQVLLDEPDIGFPNPNDVAITPDGRYALVTSGGTNRVAVVDLNRLTAMIRQASPEDRRRTLPNHTGKPTEFVVKHIPTGINPRGILVAPDGRHAYVANALDDSITVIDLAGMTASARIDLGGPAEITKTRFGERLFHDAKVTHHRQFSCATCHPDGHVDGLTYDIEADGIGISPVDNRTLRGILDTAPFKWEGTNPSLSRQCGMRLSVFFTRLEPFPPEELSALDLYVTTIPRPPNRFRPLGADFTPAQRRGKVIFERTRANDGREIPVGNRCITCHNPPYYTDRMLHDVGTREKQDRQAKFDTPHLNNIYDSAPYLHNGMANTLEEIWTVYNPNDLHGVTNDMTKDQLNDLIEYLKTL
ncbi:MAG: beta-propeller fold lactonase family protein [Bryobacteraceae bacterium]|nr:beta-propeller fold lactonase family protein [Bryobacteraceae bacterium]